jgi:L-asparaginase/Glu-tRNA(Gln) amidotransferase subunit D
MEMGSEMPHVALFALGGTIAMAGSTDGGVVARLSGQDLLTGLGDVPAEIRVHNPGAVPSASLSFQDVLEIVDDARTAIGDGAIGIVLTQGTDTLEETAFLIDCVWRADTPFVVTGAMRNPTLAGPDGPANLLAAVQVATAPDARARGALVVFNDQIHAARHVRKTHSTSTATFVSADLGPIGHLVENTPRFLASVPARAPLPPVDRTRLADTHVALYTATFDDDGAPLRALADTQHGLVIAGFGAGHVPAHLVPALTELAAVMPVVLTSRTGAGPVLVDTYGAPGSERDLLARGIIGGGYVHPYKARVLLRLLVAAGADPDTIAAAFADLG